MLYKGYYRYLIISMVIMLMMILSGCARQLDNSAPTLVIPQSQVKPIMLMNDSAENLYNYAQNGEFEKARGELERFSELITTVSYKGITTLEGVNALTKTVVNARRIYNRVQFSEQDAVLAATQLRLIADALSHQNKPMWLEYKQVLEQDTEKLLTMVKMNNDVGSLAALQMLHRHYSIIQPSIVVSKDDSLVEQISSLFNFLTIELSHSKVNYDHVVQGTDQLRDVMNVLFSGRASQTSVSLMSQQSNVMWTTFIAAVIISALAYVAWRRYKVM